MECVSRDAKDISTTIEKGVEDIDKQMYKDDKVGSKRGAL
jgi:hypothetical protein